MVKLRTVPSGYNAPFPIEGHTAFTYTSNRTGKKSLYVYGGCGKYGGNFEELYQFDPYSFEWKIISTTGTKPGGRNYHAVAMVEERYLYLFGGRKGWNLYGCDNMLYKLDLETFVWSVVEANAPGTVSPSTATATSAPSKKDKIPTSRFHHSICALDKELYVFGGYNWRDLGDFWKFSLKEKTWKRISMGVDMADIDLKKTRMEGEESKNERRKSSSERRTGSEFDDDDETEEQKEEQFEKARENLMNPGPCARYGHTMAAVGGKIFLLGGCCGKNQVLHDIWMYAPQVERWTRILIRNKPHLALEHSTLNDIWNYSDEDDAFGSGNGDEEDDDSDEEIFSGDSFSKAPSSNNLRRLSSQLSSPRLSPLSPDPFSSSRFGSSSMQTPRGAASDSQNQSQLMTKLSTRVLLKEASKLFKNADEEEDDNEDDVFEVMPSRYSASCVAGKFIIITGGETMNTDRKILDDFIIFDTEKYHLKFLKWKFPTVSLKGLSMSIFEKYIVVVGGYPLSGWSGYQGCQFLELGPKAPVDSLELEVLANILTRPSDRYSALCQLHRIQAYSLSTQVLLKVPEVRAGVIDIIKTGSPKETKVCFSLIRHHMKTEKNKPIDEDIVLNILSFIISHLTLVRTFISICEIQSEGVIDNDHVAIIQLYLKLLKNICRNFDNYKQQEALSEQIGSIFSAVLELPLHSYLEKHKLNAFAPLPNTILSPKLSITSPFSQSMKSVHQKKATSGEQDKLIDSTMKPMDNFLNLVRFMQYAVGLRVCSTAVQNLNFARLCDFAKIRGSIEKFFKNTDTKMKSIVEVWDELQPQNQEAESQQGTKRSSLRVATSMVHSESNLSLKALFDHDLLISALRSLKSSTSQQLAEKALCFIYLTQHPEELQIIQLKQQSEIAKSEHTLSSSPVPTISFQLAIPSPVISPQSSSSSNESSPVAPVAPTAVTSTTTSPPNPAEVSASILPSTLDKHQIEQLRREVKLDIWDKIYNRTISLEEVLTSHYLYLIFEHFIDTEYHAALKKMAPHSELLPTTPQSPELENSFIYIANSSEAEQTMHHRISTLMNAVKFCREVENLRIIHNRESSLSSLDLEIATNLISNFLMATSPATTRLDEQVIQKYARHIDHLMKPMTHFSAVDPSPLSPSPILSPLGTTPPATPSPSSSSSATPTLPPASTHESQVLHLLTEVKKYLQQGELMEAFSTFKLNSAAYQTLFMHLK